MALPQTSRALVTEQNKSTKEKDKACRSSVSKASTCQGKPGMLLETSAMAVWPLVLTRGGLSEL